jgi:hypothetical protein
MYIIFVCCYEVLYTYLGAIAFFFKHKVAKHKKKNLALHKKIVAVKKFLVGRTWPVSVTGLRAGVHHPSGELFCPLLGDRWKVYNMTSFARLFDNCDTNAAC